jgi:uncharacterized protein (UPF0261 family)
MASRDKTVAVIGTLDTKGEELGFLRDRLERLGLGTLLIDVGVLDPQGAEPDLDRYQVAEAGNVDLDEIAAERDRGRAVVAMADAAACLASRLYADGQIHGAIGAGGSGNTTIATAAMRALPIGVPKLMVTTLAAGDTRAYIGASDLSLITSVVDIAGLNGLSKRILDSAAAAIAGMVDSSAESKLGGERLIAATMFGVTTPCVTAARKELERRGFEVVTFHATGAGGRAMESLAAAGGFAGVLDVTTTELADELVGGILSAGKDRLTGAGLAGLPQVVSLGALDVVNFGPPETVPSQFADRLFYQHSPQVTLMRTAPQECSELGREIAAKLSRAEGPVDLFVPLRGTSAISAAGMPFHDPAADEALFGALREHVSEAVELHEIDAHVNDLEFAEAMAERLARQVEEVAEQVPERR